MYILWAVCVILTCFCVIILILRVQPILIFDKYPRKGFLYKPKYLISLLLLRYLRHKIYPLNGRAHMTPMHLEEMEKPQVLPSNPQSYDAIHFIGANEKGEKLLIKLERRRRGVLRTCLYLWLPELGLLCSPNLPDMLCFTTDGESENAAFQGNGFHIYPEQSMRRWHIHYEGDLRYVSNDELVPVKLKLEFYSRLAFFDYNRDLSASVLADCIAREAWNDEFYRMLMNSVQLVEQRAHYEQKGRLEGVIQVCGVQSTVQMNTIRSHSFGTVSFLSTVNRYVYFALFLDDGTSMIVGNLSYPQIFLSSLKVGYVCTRDGVYKSVTGTNFELYAYGEKGKPPKYNNFLVHTANKKYFVQIAAEESTIRYVGCNWESKVYNQFVSCTVNGIKGHGLTEYLYHNCGGRRPQYVSCKDPDWYKAMCRLEYRMRNSEQYDDGLFCC